MPIFSFKNPASIGIVNDMPPADLHKDAWSAGENVQFVDGKAKKQAGHDEVFTAPSASPYFLLGIQQPTTYFWMYASKTSAYLTDGTTNTDITRAAGGAYSGDDDIRWNGGIIAGIPVINNGVDDPQMFTPVQTSTDLTSLTWDGSDTWSTKGHTAKVIRTFRQYLIALDVTKSGTRYPQMVKWSTAADVASVPSTWDEADTTETAGETELAETNGYCIDCAPLRDANIVYKDDSTWGMQFVGGTAVFRFYKIFGEIGALTRECAKPFGQPNRHLVLTQGDLVVHDGAQAESVIDKRMKRWLFDQLGPDNYQRCLIVPNYRENEMWVCIPSGTSNWLVYALVWNYRDNTLAVRKLPSTTRFVSYGVIDPSEVTTWDTDSDAWDSDTTVWSESQYNPSIREVLIGAGGKFYQGATTNQADGTNFTAYLERQTLSLGDPTKVHSVTRVWPRMEGSGSVDIYVGHQMHADQAVTWEGPYAFTPGTDSHIDCRVTGRFHSIRFESTSADSWSLSGYELEVKPRGRF